MHSFHHVPLSSSLIPNISDFSALIDSGSTHCFVDTKFVNFHNLPVYPVSPIKLKLFDSDVHGILLYTENDYFYFSMHSSFLYSIFANWLCECPRIHEYYPSSVQCHTTSRLEPVSLTLRTSLRLRQIKLDDSSSHEYCHVTSHMRSHALHGDVSVYAKPVIVTRLDMVRCHLRFPPLLSYQLT